jgi:hypothetical protein
LKAIPPQLAVVLSGDPSILTWSTCANSRPCQRRLARINRVLLLFVENLRQFPPFTRTLALSNLHLMHSFSSWSYLCTVLCDMNCTSKESQFWMLSNSIRMIFTQFVMNWMKIVAADLKVEKSLEKF